MTVWKPAKDYETKYKVSTQCGVKTVKNVKVPTTVVDNDIVFQDGSKTLSAITLAINTFGEKYVHIPL